MKSEYTMIVISEYFRNKIFGTGNFVYLFHIVQVVADRAGLVSLTASTLCHFLTHYCPILCPTIFTLVNMTDCVTNLGLFLQTSRRVVGQKLECWWQNFRRLMRQQSHHPR